ncbi:hypothetical protein [Pseudooceanicola sp. 200-1SW]|uniref:hypothetical protein n=1 Tax=Pseudooceanicola sp. 200-1SW TaxID=3425949 RepID=UPI003D7FFE3F
MAAKLENLNFRLRKKRIGRGYVLIDRNTHQKFDAPDDLVGKLFQILTVIATEKLSKLERALIVNHLIDRFGMSCKHPDELPAHMLRTANPNDFVSTTRSALPEDAGAPTTNSPLEKPYKRIYQDADFELFHDWARQQWHVFSNDHGNGLTAGPTQAIQLEMTLASVAAWPLSADRELAKKKIYRAFCIATLHPNSAVGSAFFSQDPAVTATIFGTAPDV